ncbi:hypothetical protein VSR01_01385 [Actinacidiphila sp. DG2A-62]|uniref:hypothetical protein n=1 Tax=Actinacidiphila sp. DG2A-62 TaxID=3108821 RepID=UPI002DBA12F0|nr:hypothetical protein [Actinacidiphila sp. DG2A-62]MEC3992268.1 hypothetical protein [Actinacidiphila sp. DG2A-62]
MHEPTRATRPTPTILRECVMCRVNLLGGTAVALIESGSGPGHLLYACAPCVRRHRLLPLDEQPSLTGDGRLQYRP